MSLTGLSCNDLKFRWKIEPIRKQEEKLKVQIRSEECAIQRLVAQRESSEKSPNDLPTSDNKDKPQSTDTSHCKSPTKAEDSYQETVLRLRCERKRKKLASLHTKKDEILWSFVQEWLQVEIERLSVETCLKNNQSVARLADCYARYPKDVLDEEEFWKKAEEVMAARRFMIENGPEHEDDTGSQRTESSALDEDTASQTSSTDISDSGQNEGGESSEESHDDKEKNAQHPIWLSAEKQDYNMETKKEVRRGKTRKNTADKKAAVRRIDASTKSENYFSKHLGEMSKVTNGQNTEIQASNENPVSDIEATRDDLQGAQGPSILDSNWATDYLERVAISRCPWDYDIGAKEDWEFARRLQLEYETENLTSKRSRAFIEDVNEIHEREDENSVGSLNLSLVEEPQEEPVCSDKVDTAVCTTPAFVGQVTPVNSQIHTYRPLRDSQATFGFVPQSTASPIPVHSVWNKPLPRSVKMPGPANIPQRRVATASQENDKHSSKTKSRHKPKRTKCPPPPRFTINRANKSRQNDLTNKGKSKETSLEGCSKVGNPTGISEVCEIEALPEEPGPTSTEFLPKINQIPEDENEEAVISESEFSTGSDFKIDFIHSAKDSNPSVNNSQDVSENIDSGRPELPQSPQITFMHSSPKMNAIAYPEQTHDKSAETTPVKSIQVPPLDLSKLSNSSPEAVSQSQVSEAYDGIITLDGSMERCSFAETVSQNSTVEDSRPSSVKSSDNQVGGSITDPFFTKSPTPESAFDFVFHGCITTASPGAPLQPQSSYTFTKFDRLSPPRLTPCVSAPNEFVRPVIQTDPTFQAISSSWISGFSPRNDPWGTKDFSLIPPAPGFSQCIAPVQFPQQHWSHNEAASNHIKQLLRISNDRAFRHQHRHPAFQAVRSGNPTQSLITSKSFQSNFNVPQPFNNHQQMHPVVPNNVQNARGDASNPVFSLLSHWPRANFQNFNQAPGVGLQMHHGEQFPRNVEYTGSNVNVDVDNSSVFFPSSSVFESSLGI